MPVSFTPGRKDDDTPHALFQIAREHFVGARLCFLGSSLFSAQVLMQQCLELGTKALLKHTTPARKFGGPSGHKLRALLEEAATTHVALKRVLTAPDIGKVIDVLDSGYNPIRYGEGILGVHLGGELEAFDELAWILLSEVGTALRYQSPLVLTVADVALDTFLRRFKLPIVSVVRVPDRDQNEWARAVVTLSPSKDVPDGSTS